MSVLGEPRGIRNNNPGNIRHSDTVWYGQALNQDDPAFVQFSDPEYGIRAIAKILLTYQRDGLNSVQGIINRWAPPSENDTDAYVQAVCNGCGVASTSPIDVRAELPGLIKAIIQHENGEQPYTDDQIDRGVALALGIET
jgi:hypothetical protein